MLATRYRSDPIYQYFRDLNQRLSMLHPDVLALLYHYGACASGQILELGPYVGGSTISLARGVKDAKVRLESPRSKRVADTEHPTFSTTDIVESLRTNLKNYGVADKVDLIVGHSRDPTVLNQLAEVSKRNGKFACLGFGCRWSSRRRCCAIPPVPRSTMLSGRRRLLRARALQKKRRRPGTTWMRYRSRAWLNRSGSTGGVHGSAAFSNLT